MARKSAKRRVTAHARLDERVPGFEMSQRVFEREMTIDDGLPHHWERHLVTQECATAWLCRMVEYERDLQFCRYPTDVAPGVAMAQIAPAASAGVAQPVTIASERHYWPHVGVSDCDPEYAVGLLLDYAPIPAASAPTLHLLGGGGRLRVFQTDRRARNDCPRVLAVAMETDIGTLPTHVHLRAYRQFRGDATPIVPPEPWGLVLRWSRTNPYRLRRESATDTERGSLHALLATPVRPLVARRRRQAAALLRTACRHFTPAIVGEILAHCP